MKLVIENEMQAWEALERAISTGFPDGVQLEFQGWPVLTMNVQGRDWNSTVPTRVMTPFLDVQKDINRAYAAVRYGSANLRKLRDEERDDLEVVIRVREGSSLFDAELVKHFATITQAAAARMSGTQVVITVLGLGLLITAPVIYKAWLAGRAREKEIDLQREMSAEETRKLQVMADALTRQSLLLATQEDVQATQNRLLKVAKPGDVLNLKETPITATTAAQLAQPERERAQDVFLNGDFTVLGNRTDKSEGFRINVRRESDQMTIHADVPVDLPHEQQLMIQRAEWSKKKIYLEINASLLRESISQATVVSAREISGE